MKKVSLIWPLATVLLMTVSSVDAQQPRKVFRIGFVSVGSGIDARTEAFRQTLRELGYIEGKNIIIEWRYAEGKVDRRPAFVNELVRLNVDCLVTVGVEGTRLAKQATGTIPIVMADADDDPVRRGLIDSLARPGGNVTGVTSISSDLAGKRLELFKEAVPGLTRMAILAVSKSQVAAGHVRETEGAARALGVELQLMEVSGPESVDSVLQAARKGRAGALMVIMVGGMGNHLPQITKLAINNRLPTMFTQSRAVPEGGLMSYAADLIVQYRRTAVFVDKILKGAKPADLPVEQPTKFELVINLKTAKQIGLTIPPNVLARADRVIR
jgi:putative ABC transport system substrate-binding protein